MTAYDVTAAPDAANARVAVTAQGGRAGDVLYLFRRDSQGVGVVRDTSAATVVWPAYGAALRTNLLSNPKLGVDTTGWSTTLGSGGTSTPTRSTTGSLPSVGGYYYRVQLTAATTTSPSGISCAASGTGGAPVTPGTSYVVSAWAYCTRSCPVRVDIQWYDAAGALLSTAAGVATTIAASAWERRSNIAVAPASAAYARPVLWYSSTMAVNDMMGATGALVEPGTTLQPYFDGDTSSTVPTVQYAWRATANASISDALSTVPLTIYDSEARQGEGTDYILADADGVQLDSVHVTIPAWGTWLKDPGRPYLNTRCYLENEGAVKRPANRLVVTIEGANQATVLSEARGGRQGELRLLALDGAMAAAVDSLLDRGGTLMLDSDPSWGSPYRYISVGDSASSRPYFDGTLGLDRPVRLFTLSDVVAVEAPIGVSAVDQGRTYDQLSTLYGSYAAMAATVATYEALAVG